jgi:hypothetical protein
MPCTFLSFSYVFVSGKFLTATTFRAVKHAIDVFYRDKIFEKLEIVSGCFKLCRDRYDAFSACQMFNAFGRYSMLLVSNHRYTSEVKSVLHANGGSSG